MAVKEGDIRTACRNLEHAIDLTNDPTLLANAWFWLSETSHDPAKKRKFLENTLAHEIHHAQARRSLAILDGKLSPDEIVDPENLPKDPDQSPQETGTERFACPTCGGKMTYTPDGNNLICESCNQPQVIESYQLPDEQDFIVAMATSRGHRPPTQMTTFKCQGCGADFLLAPGDLSSDCSYCGSAHVVAMESLHELVEPDSILPMSLQQSQALAFLKIWIQKNNIQPDGSPQPPRGLYMPLWSFDIGGQIVWNGEKVQNKRVVTIKGQDVVSFNDLAIPASKPLASLLEKMLGSFDLVNAPVYDTSYLAGWPAKVYEIPMAEASLDARHKACLLVKRKILSKEGALENLNYSTAELFIESFRLTLVPVWVSAYTLQMQKYAVLINGYNGEVQAEMPRRGLSDWLKGKLT